MGGNWLLDSSDHSENQNTQSGEEKPEQRLFFMYKIMGEVRENTWIPFSHLQASAYF